MKVKLNNMELFQEVQTTPNTVMEKVPGGWVRHYNNKEGFVVKSLFIPKSDEVGDKYYEVI